MCLLRWPGGGPGRSGDLNFGFFAVSRLTRQRARRRAWRGRSSSASLRAWSLRARRSALTRPSGGGAGSSAGWGACHRAATRGSLAKKWMRGAMPRGMLGGAGAVPRSFSADQRAGRRDVSAPPCPISPRRHGTRRCWLHHKAARRDDNKAAHGGFGGPQHAQHGAVERAAEAATAWRRQQAPAWRTGLQ